MTDDKQTRREAIVKISQASALAAVPQVVSTADGAQRSNTGGNRIRIGMIGCGVRGKYLIANLPPAGQMVALCDCSLSQIESTRNPTGTFREPLAEFARGDGKRCSVYQDYRIMCERESLDAVMIAAPDHHHALPTILACQKGLDVYIEKPLALTIAEGRAMVHAANEHQRVVQVGSQQRTMQVNRFACEFIRRGGLGRVSRVQTLNFPGPLPYESTPQLPTSSAPKDIDWDLFCGPTPSRPYDQNLWMKDAYKHGYLTWRGWDLFRSYSGHLMTNWGGHSVDMVQYALGMDDTGPVEIELHPRLIDEYVDDIWHEKTPPLGTAKNKNIDKMRFCPLTMRYANGVELRFDPTVRETVFHGERGKLYLSRNEYRTEPVGLAPPPDKAEQLKWKGDGHVARPHIENWLACIESRSKPNAPIEVGHRTATVCHLANIARELRTNLNWDPVAERFREQAANRLLSRPRRIGFELPDSELSR